MHAFQTSAHTHCRLQLLIHIQPTRSHQTTFPVLNRLLKFLLLFHCTQGHNSLQNSELTYFSHVQYVFRHPCKLITLLHSFPYQCSHQFPHDETSNSVPNIAKITEKFTPLFTQTNSVYSLAKQYIAFSRRITALTCNQDG